METLTTGRITALASPPLAQWADGFLLARRAEGRSPRTVKTYKDTLSEFTRYCAERNLSEVESIDPSLIREYIVHLGERLAPTTVHQHYATLRTFLNWYAEEAAADGWRNPIDRVKPPKVDLPPLPPADLGDVSRMIAACAGRNASRERAILLPLTDAGLRAGELLRLQTQDFDQTTGALTISKSKSRKPRTVYLGKKARHAVRAYLRERGGKPGALFASDDPRSKGGGLGSEGLRGVIIRRAADAGVKAPKIHAFRRAAALALVRNGADLLTVSRILGHSGLELLKRYVNQTGEDLRQAAERFSPADRL